MKHDLANIAAAATDSEMVAAITDQVIYVLQVAMVSGGTATNVTFNSASTAISCLFANAANGGAVLPFSEKALFKTTAGEALTVTTGDGSTTGILILFEYREA